jgi:hypothetical protein
MNIGVPILVEVLREKDCAPASPRSTNGRRRLSPSSPRTADTPDELWDEMLELGPELLTAYTGSRLSHGIRGPGPQVKELIYIAFTTSTHLYTNASRHISATPLATPPPPRRSWK